MTTQIIKAFNKAVETYNEHACVQRHAARAFASKLLTHFPLEGAGKKALEIGCGTGLLTQELLAASLFDDIHITDLAEKMVAYCALNYGHDKRLSFSVLDGQKLDEKAQFDFVVSNLTFQWFDCLVTTIKRLLQTSPHVAFTAFGSHSFQEWRQACEALNVQHRLRFLYSPEYLIGAISQFATIEIQKETKAYTYSSWFDFWQSLKAIGAHRGVGNPTLSLKHWRLLETGEVTVTFEILYCFVERP